MRKAAIVLLSIGLALLVSCAGGPGLKTWFVDSLIKVFPDDPPGANEAHPHAWLVARNGHINIQLAARSAKGITKLNVKIEAPRRGDATLKTMTRWVEYVPVGSNPPGTPYDEVIRQAPALYPDPLREDFPLTLRANRTQPVWVTVYAPADAEPGKYEGRITLLDGEQPLASKTFRVEVVAATVPAKQKLQVTNWFNLSAARLQRFYKVNQYSDQYWKLLENIGRVMALHKQNVLLTPVSSLARPSLIGGKIRYDFSRLDRWVEVFERAGLLGTIEGGHLLGRSSGYSTPIVVPATVVEGGKIVRKNLDPDDPRAERYLRGFLGALYTHLKEKGWEKRYIQHIHDEPHGLEAPVYNRYAKIIRASLPGVPTIDAVSLGQDVSFFAHVCDIWVPVLGSFDRKFEMLRNHVKQGGQVWFYTCISPQGRYLNRFIDYPLLKVRLLHWFNFRYKLTGFLHWGGNYWGPEPFRNVQPVINDNRTLLPAGDNALVYPNPEKNSVLSSIRLEAMRAGIEDYELLRELAGKEPAKAAALAREAIPHINDYVRDPVVFRNLHRRLLLEVTK